LHLNILGRLFSGGRFSQRYNYLSGEGKSDFTLRPCIFPQLDHIYLVNMSRKIAYYLLPGVNLKKTYQTIVYIHSIYYRHINHEHVTKGHKMFTIKFTALITIVLSNLWLFTNVSYAVPISPTTQLPTIKIIFPHKNQQIRVGADILVSGISSPPPGVSHTGCTVSILINDVKPYQKTVALEHRGKGDYSLWHYNITHKYASLKQGQNKITAKISCATSPSNPTKFNSVNVTGI